MPVCRTRHRLSSPTMIAAIALGGMLALLWGCDIPRRPPLASSDLEPVAETEPVASAPPSEPANPGDGFEVPLIDLEQRWETWDAYFIGDRRVGYNHLVADPQDPQPRPTGLGQRIDPNREINFELDNVLYVKQGNARTLQRLLQTSTETVDGRVLSFDATLIVGPVATHFQGTMEADQLRIETVRGSKRTTETITWQAHYRGLMAVEQSLRDKPMLQEGQTRQLRLLLPGHYELATARLRCSGMASVPLLDQSSAELIEINYEIQLDDKPASYSTIWTDTSGAIIRTYSPGIELVSYRTDAATAMAVAGDADEVVAVALSGKINEPESAQRVAFLVSPTKEASEAGKSVDIQPAPQQFIRAKGDGSFQVLISRNPQETAGEEFESIDLVPDEQDSKANYFVDYRDAMVRRFVDAAIGRRELSDREAASELTQVANSLVVEGPATDGLVRASEVVRAGVADSTGRSILLAALLRARGIPARMVIGLKYAPDSPKRMVYHMWTMAYAEDQWIHLDASDGDLAAADRLVLGHTNLSGGDEYAAFVPFLNTISRMKIQILNSQ